MSRFRGNAGSHDVALGVDTLRVRVCWGRDAGGSGLLIHSLTHLLIQARFHFPFYTCIRVYFHRFIPLVHISLFYTPLFISPQQPTMF